ncbi:MAG: hypothetical protein Q7K55_04075 [Candidatus Levybacteria bacterium]|nr:hypothetical protein [Candidatus Levybacteria bacterium]
MELPHQQVVTNDDIININIYQDIISFLKRLAEKPIKLTAIGNISLRDIEGLLAQLLTTKHVIDEHVKYNWKVRSEWDLQTLTQIKILLLVMDIIHKRKGYICLNKTGKTFLSQSPLQQYEQIVLTFWNKCNWAYFSNSNQVGPSSLPEVLQDIRSHLWKLFLQKGTSWIDYPTFCKSARDYFHLNEYLREPYAPEDREVRFLDIEYDLFKRNLELFGCIEIEEIQGNTNGMPASAVSDPHQLDYIFLQKPRANKRKIKTN